MERSRPRCEGRHADARGLQVSPGGLQQNELVKRPIGDFLEFKFLQAFHLLNFRPAKFLAPA